MKEKNRQYLLRIEQKILDGTVSSYELELYSRWYNWKQNEPVEIEENLSISFNTQKEKIFDNVIDELDKNGQSFRSFYRHYDRRVRRQKIVKITSIFSVLILFITVGIYLILNPFKTKDIVYSANDIHPGKSGLVLTLDNGKQIMIDSVNDGLLAIQNGVKVYKRNGQIEYEGNTGKTIYNTASTDNGRQYKIELPDHSMVWLNSKSKLRYPISFVTTDRVVALEGEGYFEISHTKNNTPFYVHFSNKTIKVLGTHFNINSYENESDVVATLLQGSIQFISGKSQVVIRPNEAASVGRYKDQIKVENVDASNSILWLKKEFNFENQTLEEIMKQLERWYGITVIYDKNVNIQMQFAGSTPMNQNLAEVLKVLELEGLHFKLENKELIVTN